MNEVIINYDFKDKIILINDIEYVPREILEQVIRDRRNIAMDNAKLYKDIQDLKKAMHNKKNEVEKEEEELTKVRLVPETDEPLERKIYPNWAFTKRGREKSKINSEIYEELVHKYKVSYDERLTEVSDVVILIDYEAYCKSYYVSKNEPQLTADEIALIVDNGNLCFGYSGTNQQGKVWTD